MRFNSKRSKCQWSYLLKFFQVWIFSSVQYRISLSKILYSKTHKKQIDQMKAKCMGTLKYDRFAYPDTEKKTSSLFCVAVWLCLFMLTSVKFLWLIVKLPTCLKLSVPSFTSRCCEPWACLRSSWSTISTHKWVNIWW